MIRVILIRHGRTAWNIPDVSGERFRGSLDLPLAADGVAQAKATAARLAGSPLAAVYSSPLERAMHTAEIIAQPHRLNVHPVPALTSVDYGLWAGKTHAEVVSTWPDLYEQWRNDPFHVQFPEGGSTGALRETAGAALRSLLARHDDGDSIAVVSHQIVTRTLTCSLLGLPDSAYWRIRQDLCNLTMLGQDSERGQFGLMSLNDACHLDTTLPQARGTGTRIILIRHGQTAWNQGAGEERFRGRIDLSLDTMGHRQAEAIALRLQKQEVAAVYASPLLRTRQTIAPLAARYSLPVTAHDGLLDIDYGQFHGLTHSSAQADFPELYAQWRSSPSQVHFPGGERLADIQTRLVSLLAEMRARHPAQTVILLGHQIVNKVLACTMLGLDLDQIWRIGQDTAALSVYQWTRHGWRTLCINDTCHLQVAE